MKRVGEVLCVHRYSGSMDGKAGVAIGVYYALLSLLIASQQSAAPAALYEGVAATVSLQVGTVMFCVGQAGNFWHHWLLANMRSGSSKGAATVYSVPSGGMFNLVTMPHYFFESMAWFGIAAVTQQLNAVLVAVGVTSYLSGRAVATTTWYKSKFGNQWPVERRHLVPYIF